MKQYKFIFTICMALFATSLVAQNRHFNSQTLGMGGGGTAFIDGYHSNFLNPANLMINNTGRKPSNTLGILGGIGLSAGGSLLNQQVYEDYFTKGLTLDGYTEGTPRVDMLNAWFGGDSRNTRDISFAFDVVPFGFSHRGKSSAFSLAIRSRTIEDLTINKGFAELAFYGLDSQKFGDPVPVNFANTLLSYTEVSVGYAMELPIPLTGLIEKVPFINGMKVYAGVAPKYIIGMQSFEMDFTSTLEVNNASDPSGAAIIHDFEYALSTYGELSEQLSAYADAREENPDAKLDDYVDYSGSDVGSLGSGFGVDLGVTAELDVSIPALGFLGKRQVLRVSMSMTDLGSVNFDKTPSQVQASSEFVFDADPGEDEIDDYFDELSDSLQNNVYGGFSSTSTNGSKYTLPGMYNFGAALTLGKLTTTLDYGVGFNDLGRNTKISRLNLGLEYRLLNFIPLRFGTRIGGGLATGYSAGFGLDFRFLEFTVAGSTVASGADKGVSVGVAYSGLVIRF